MCWFQLLRIEPELGLIFGTGLEPDSWLRTKIFEIMLELGVNWQISCWLQTGFTWDWMGLIFRTKSNPNVCLEELDSKPNT